MSCVGSRFRGSVPSLSLVLAGWLIQQLLGGGGALALAAEPAAAPQFIRIVADESDQPIRLQTAVVRYANRSNPAAAATVDLIGAIHIAEKSYYDTLNRLFDGYDAVLYELVADPKTNVPQPGTRSAHPVGVMQVAMKNLLGLEFQLDGVNYQRPQFVHADLSPDEFAKRMEERGESFTRLLFRMMGQGVAQQSTDPARTNDLALVGALFSGNRSQDLKRLMARQFTEMDKANAVLNGPDGSTIITDRNRRVIEVLAKQLQAGKQRLAIFYGAAHLPDFDNRLRTEFGMQPVEHRWLDAWNLAEDPARAEPASASK